MPAIPLPNQGSTDILTSARADAMASLRNAGPEGQKLASTLDTPRAAAAPLSSAAQPPDTYTAEPPPDAVDMVPADTGPPPPAPPAAPAQTHGNGDMWSMSNLGDFLRDEFQGTPKELGYGVMRGLAKAGQAGYTLTAGTAAAVADHVAGALLGTNGQAKTVTGAEDKVFDWKKQYFDQAVQDWTPDRQDVTGQGQGSGGAAQALGGAAEMAPNLVTGPAGLGALVATTGVNSATDSLDQGHSLRSSVAIAAVDTIATALQAQLHLLPGQSLPMLKRMLVQVPAGDVVAVAQDLIKKQVLAKSGNQTEADKINPLDNLGEDTVNNIAFGLLPGGKHGEPPKTALDMPPAQPVPEAGDQTTGTTVGLKPPGGVQNPAPPPVAATPPAPTVPDAPTAEPMKDLRAQLRDMNDPATPRTGVFLSSMNQANLTADMSKDSLTIQRQIDQAQKTGRVVQTPQGMLVLKDKATALKAQQQLKSGVDPQVIIGQATGAGDGKQTTDTVAVQGQTPDGAVAIEKTVAPAEVPAAVQDTQAQGKTPVVMSVPDALQRRADEIQAPPPEAVDMPPAKPPEAAAPPEAEEGASAQRGIIKTGGGDRAVIVHDATPDAEGKISVSPIDDDGEPGPQIKVPAAALTSKTEKPSDTITEKPQPAPTPEAGQARPDATEHQAPAAVPEPPKPESPLEGLKKAAATLKGEDTPAGGKKFAGKLSERAANVAGFARALETAAKGMSGDDAAHAITVAKAARGLDLKTDEAIKKNQGIGHTELNVHRDNLLDAARKLYDPQFERPPAREVKAVKLQARVDNKTTVADRLKAKREAEVAQLAKEQAAEKPAPKTKVIADVEDETKPKQLTKGEQLKLAAAGKRLIAADDDSVDARSADIDKIIKEIYGPRLSDDERAAFIKSLTNERAERLRPKSRNDEIDEEFNDNRRMDNGDDDELEHQAGPFRDLHPDVVALHNTLKDGGVYDKLLANPDKAQFKARDVLDTFSKGATGAMRSFLQKISRSMPEQTMLRPVTAVMGKGERLEKTSGLFNDRQHLIQVRTRDAADPMLTHTIIHEATHAATYHLMRGAPDHPMVKQATHLYKTFIDRMRAKYGDMVDQHINYFNGTGERPADFSNDLYGMANPAEHMAEVAANGKYRDLIAKSEKFKQPGEGFLGGAHDLAKSTFNALKGLLGMGDREGALLHSTMRNLENVMEAQGHLLNERADDAVSDLHSLAMLDHDPKPLKDEPRLRGIVGDTMATTARQYYRSIQSGSLHALRRLILANERHQQFTRTNAHWFGKDDEHNPMRQWDSTKQDAVQMQNKILEHGRSAVQDRQRLARSEDAKLGQIQIESQQWGFNPELDKASQTTTAKKSVNFDARFDDFKRRWESLTPEAKAVFRAESDHNKWSARIMRKAGTDAALDTFSDRDVTAAQRSLLYSARTKGDFDALIGQGKQIDVGDRNEDLKKTLQELSGGNQIQGHFFHLGRDGDYVVEVNPEVEREFDTQSEAETHAAQVRETGPNAKAKVTNLGGKWQVSGKATYLSMHRSAHEAGLEADRLRARGHDVGPITNKIESESGGALSAATQNLVAAAKIKLERRGAGPETQALTDALRGTFVQMVADRSAYAASKLARKGFGGVKAAEMGRNFAAHVQSSAWNIANLGTTFKQGEALGKLRDAAKRPTPETSQTVVYKRGAVMREIGKRTAQEVSQYGLKNPTNAVTAKLGYMNYLASPAHTLVNMTQNFTTGLPVAGARWGYGKSLALFAQTSKLMAGPTFRAGMKAFKPGNFNAEDMVGHAINQIAKDPRFGKWSPALKQMLDRGGLNSSFANEIGHQGQGGNITIQRAFDYARILPQMAEVYNRISSALVALESTGGNVTKATDYVNEVHMNYSQADQTRVMKSFAKIPGANTLTMFRTYTQGMFHLLYSNVKNMVTAESKSRGEAAKTVAGLILAQSLTAGVIKGAYIEPLRLAVYAYNQLFGDSDEYSDLDNTTRRFLADHLGDKAGDVVAGGLPHLLGFDLSSRMGLSDLLLHDPPDLLHADSKQMMEFMGTLLSGPMGQMVAEHKDAFMAAMDRGDAFGAISQIVPIKAVRDISQAIQLASTGKQAGNGAQMTDPSALDAVYRAIGLKPVDVEQAQEKEGSIIQYKGFIADRKQRLIKAYENSDDKGSVLSAISGFNATNPGNRIQSRDLQQGARGAQRTQRDLEGMDKDPEIRDLTDY